MKSLAITFCIIFLCGCTEEYFFTKALECEAAGEYEKAIEYLDKVISKNPLRTWAYVNRAADKEELSDFTSAIEDYSKAISIDSMLVAGYMGMAHLYMKQQDYSSALANYNSAISKSGIIETDNKIIAFSTGNAATPNRFSKYEKSNKYEDPFYPTEEMFFERAVAYFFLDNLDFALRDFDFCLSNEISTKMERECHYWIGHIFLKIGQIEDGCNALKTSITLGDNYAKEDYNKYCECNNK